MKSFLVLCVSLCLVEALDVPCNSPCLLISTRKDIAALDYNNVTSYPIISNLRKALAIDIHFSLGYIFWSEYWRRTIKRANIDGSNITVLHHSNTLECNGLAVEWRSFQLYWTDDGSDTISVSDLEGNNTRILISSSLDKPSGIALDPNNGLMFWTDSGQTPKIERATLSGSQRVAIVTSNLLSPNGIDLDRRNKLVFWVDAGTDRVESVDYHGNNRKILFQQEGLRFIGVTFFSPFLFVTDSETKRIYKFSAFDTSGTVLGNVDPNTDPNGLVAYDSSRQFSVCPALSAPSNGTRLGCPGNETIYYDTTCQFSCNNGYIGSGSQVRRCQHNGTWSGQDFTCQMITCPALPAPSNGTRLGCPGNATMYYDTVCHFSCNNGYIGSGSQVRRCQLNGTWSGQDFTCQNISSTSIATTETEGSKPTLAIFIGACLGGVLFLAIILIIVVVFACKRRDRSIIYL